MSKDAAVTFTFGTWSHAIAKDFTVTAYVLYLGPRDFEGCCSAFYVLYLKSLEYEGLRRDFYVLYL